MGCCFEGLQEGSCNYHCQEEYCMDNWVDCWELHRRIWLHGESMGLLALGGMNNPVKQGFPLGYHGSLETEVSVS